jgi:hypothetical protein
MLETVQSILRRLIESTSGGLTKGMAEAILELKFSENDQARVSELGDKSNAGTLTTEEGQEYDNYIAAANLLSLWKSKARLALKQHSSAA